MKHLITAILAASLVTPATAQDRMLRSDCQLAVERIADIVAPDAPSTPRLLNAIRVTPQGWCQMRGGGDGLEDAEFDTLEWRADAITRWTRDGIPPLAVQMRITGLDPDEMQGRGANTNRPDVTVEATVRQIPDAGLVVVERAVMQNGAGDEMSVSGVFERVFLSSPSMMQVSMGSATFKAGLASMTLDGTHENPFGFNLDVDVQGVQQSQRDAAFDVISRVPDGVIDDASRAELTAYAGDLPKPVGNLEVSVASERGLGLMQVGMSMYAALSTIANDGEASNEMEILLDGLSITADWTPAAQVAD